MGQTISIAFTSKSRRGQKSAQRSEIIIDDGTPIFLDKRRPMSM